MKIVGRLHRILDLMVVVVFRVPGLGRNTVSYRPCISDGERCLTVLYGFHLGFGVGVVFDRF